MAGSDKRQRGKIHPVRCTFDEFKAIAAKADQAGLSIPAFMRAAALGDAGPRAQRRPSVGNEPPMAYTTAPSLIDAPPDVSPEVRDLLARCDDMALAYDKLLLNAEATGKIDPARLRDCLAIYGQSRRELLTALGEDPESEELLPFPAEVHDA
jgi:hypothetical protein